MVESRQGIGSIGRLKTIRLVLGFSPGSASDEIARALAPALSRVLGASIEIELRPGANGSTAAAQVAAAPADGKTLFVATLGTHALAPHLNAALPYDPLHHFRPVSLVAKAPLVLACHPSLGVGNARALIELARARPSTLGYGTSAVGGAPHLAAELFQDMAGIALTHVRYDRTGDLYQDLEAGRIALSFNNAMSMLPRCRSGRLQALGVTSTERSLAAPDIPALGADTLPGYDVSNWVGIVAPRATPEALVDALSGAIAAALGEDEVRETFLRAGVTPSPTTPESFAAFIAAQIARWGPVVARFKNVSA
jgi:tripartite-type tricarboxylate transporter receptor subunit TctC